MQTENIQKFLMPPSEGGAYSEEKLAALLAHAQDGKLGYGSCCCLVGIPTAQHALLGAGWYCLGDGLRHLGHLERARMLPHAIEAETEFDLLGYPGDGVRPPTDALRRERLIPLILAEQLRREKLRTPSPETLEEPAEMQVAR